MTEVENDEEKEIDPLVSESKVTEALNQMMKEFSTLKVRLQTRKVTKNQCCNNILEYLFSLTGKPLYDKLVVVTKDDHKKNEDNSPKKKEDPKCFSIPVAIKRLYVVDVML